MQEELHSRPDILQVHEQVPGLLDHPRTDRVLGGSEDAYPAGVGGQKSALPVSCGDAPE